MGLFFITGNLKKFEEAQAIIPNIEQLDIDLPEIQELDPNAIIREKLQGALKFQAGSFIVEDTSLFLDCLNGFPGPLIKWFMKSIGNEGIYRLSAKYGDYRASAKTIIGYANISEGIHFFEGSINGTIVSPEGKSGFGWDPIFQPEGFNTCFAEMTPVQKNSISMRQKAFHNLKIFLGP